MPMTIVETTRAVTGGVDTHADVHVAAAVDANGGVLGVESFATTPAGYEPAGPALLVVVEAEALMGNQYGRPHVVAFGECETTDHQCSVRVVLDVSGRYHRGEPIRRPRQQSMALRNPRFSRARGIWPAADDVVRRWPRPTKVTYDNLAEFSDASWAHER
jgi:hypothetical protein